MAKLPAVKHLRSALAGLFGVFTVTAALADGAAVESPTDLAVQDQNPLTRYYVLRFEDNVQFGFGPDNEAINFFRIQPLLPYKLSEDWSVLTRLIIPIAHQPWPDSTDGLSDIAAVSLLTPTRGGRFTWGVGPGLILPTATDDAIGTEKWAAGPSAAAIYMTGPWVIGAVVQNLWSFAGAGDRADVNTLVLRPLLNFNLPRGWYLTSSPSIVANWEADAENRWFVPVGGGVGKVFAVGRQRLSTTAEAYYHVKAPSIGPDWQLRVQLSFLYPD